MRNAPSLQPIDTTTMHERCYQELRTGLMSGYYKPGDVVTLRGVAEALGTSLTPVREAVRRLVSERALEMPNSRSVRVPLMGQKAFDDLIAIRLVLEPMAVRLATALMPPKAVSELDAINRNLMKKIELKDIRSAMSINREFHSRLYEQSDNDSLTGVIDALWTQSGPYINLLLDRLPHDQIIPLFAAHNMLIERLQERDASGAADVMVKIIAPATQLYRSMVDQ